MDTALHDAHAASLARWRAPFAGFASGHDPRTSDQALLGLTYGSLVHAARYDWSNAGRRLIDKTYVDMLWHVQQLTNLRAVRPEQVSAALDAFIGDAVQAQWHELAQLSPRQAFDLAADWVHQLAGRCFGSIQSELAASRLAFYLFPMLPLFNLSSGHIIALRRLGYPPEAPGYHGFADAAMSAYDAHKPVLLTFPAPPVDTTTQRHDLVSALLRETDWWPRRVFDQALRATVLEADGLNDPVFTCDDAGKPWRARETDSAPVDR